MPWPPNAGMDAVAVADGDLRSMTPSPFVVLSRQTPGADAEEQIAAVVEQAAGDVVGRIGVEALDHDVRRVGDAVAVGVLDAVEPLLELARDRASRASRPC